jgi:beta propeller repeat protein
VENSLASLKLPQKLPGPLTYLTIMANPRAIPMARENRATKPALWGNRAVFEEIDPSKVDAKPLGLAVVTYDTSAGSVGSETIPTTAGGDLSPAIYEDKVVWQGGGDIHLYNLTTKTKTAITNDSYAQKNPAIYGNKIVWMDNRNTYKDTKGKTRHHWDIYMYDLSEVDPQEKEMRITTDSGDQTEPAIYEDNIIWQDKRKGNWDIYMHDLKQKKEVPICTDPKDQINPAVGQNKIVWQDKRNGNWDIYMHDLSEVDPQKRETRITTDPAHQFHPSVSAGGIVWEDARHGNSSVYIYDKTKTEKRLTTSGSKQLVPVIQGDHIVWFSDGKTGVSPVHVAPPAGPHGGRWLTYFHDISTGAVLYYQNLLTHVHSTFRQEADGRYYGSYINYGYQDRAVGRIFGITVSDVSAYVARDLFFEDIRPQARDALLIVREDHNAGEIPQCPGVKNPVIDGCNLEHYAKTAYWTPAVRAEFTPAPAGHFYAGITTGSHPVDKNTQTIKDLYDDCYLILYADHGWPGGFSGGYTTDWLRKDKISLLPSTILDLACATGTVFWGYVPPDDLFGMENIRRGAMVYMGAVDNSYWHRMFDDILEGVFIDGKTIGEAYVEARNEEYDDCMAEQPAWPCGDSYYALFGDPTFEPRWWP